MMMYSGSPGHSLLMYCALLSLPQTYELAQPDAELGMHSVLSIVSLMLKELAERADALQSAAAAKTGTDISHPWTEADSNSVAGAVGSKSSSAGDVLDALSAQREQLATTKDDFVELSSAVCVLLLDLGKILGVEVSIRLHCLTGDASMHIDSVPC
jgi:hypothetical protein